MGFKYARQCNAEAAAHRAAQFGAEEAMRPKIAAVRAEGRRQGWLEALGKLKEIRQRYLGGSYGEAVVESCEYQLREKMEKLL
jgi:hypothetical protein